MKNIFTKIAHAIHWLPFVSDWRWFRKLHGGSWAHVHVDFPVCSCVWLPVDQYTDGYMEPLWRGTPEWEHYFPWLDGRRRVKIKGGHDGGATGTVWATYNTPWPDYHTVMVDGATRLQAFHGSELADALPNEYIECKRP